MTEMLKKLKEFAEQLRERGYYVDVGYNEDEIFERYSLLIEKDKTKKDDYFG